TDSVYLYVETDTTVILLNKNKQQPEHPDHHRLWKKSDMKHSTNMHHNKHHSHDTHHEKQH
ncbi:MAG: hypothetical protein IKY13_05910, partial [Bacteroidaceae bacterium]|nr:hypothetical protein [Bacteroidaceae bacterium]